MPYSAATDPFCHNGHQLPSLFLVGAMKCGKRVPRAAARGVARGEIRDSKAYQKAPLFRCRRVDVGGWLVARRPADSNTGRRRGEPWAPGSQEDDSARRRPRRPRRARTNVKLKSTRRRWPPSASCSMPCCCGAAAAQGRSRRPGRVRVPASDAEGGDDRKCRFDDDMADAAPRMNPRARLAASDRAMHFVASTKPGEMRPHPTHGTRWRTAQPHWRLRCRLPPRARLGREAALEVGGERDVRPRALYQDVHLGRDADRHVAEGVLARRSTGRPSTCQCPRRCSRASA